MSNIPILISSPFEAMRHERDILHRVVLPELRQLARTHDAELSEVDLQWGITATPDVTNAFLEVVASELSRTSIVVALLNGDGRYREDPVQKTIRTLQIYIAHVSKSSRLVAFMPQGRVTDLAYDSGGEAEALGGPEQTDIALAARLRERGVVISSYSS